MGERQSPGELAVRKARVSAANKAPRCLSWRGTTVPALGSVLARLPDPSALPSGRRDPRLRADWRLQTGRCHVPHRATPANRPLQTLACAAGACSVGAPSARGGQLGVSACGARGGAHARPAGWRGHHPHLSLGCPSQAAKRSPSLERPPKAPGLPSSRLPGVSYQRTAPSGGSGPPGPDSPSSSSSG